MTRKRTPRAPSRIDDGPAPQCGDVILRCPRCLSIAFSAHVPSSEIYCGECRDDGRGLVEMRVEPQEGK